MRSRRRRRRSRAVIIIPLVLVCLMAVAAGMAFLWFAKGQAGVRQAAPDERFMEYTGYLTEGNYEAMYRMLDSGSRMDISQEDFITRNKKIYEGIGASSIRVDITGVEEKEDQGIQTVSYETSMESLAGTIHFFNQADFKLEASSGAAGTDSHDSEKAGKKRKEAKDEEYRLIWNDRVIFPNLSWNDKVRVTTDKAVRGSVLDRNGIMLAGKGSASMVGLVPGKMSREADNYSEDEINMLSELLGVSADSIRKKLSANWVKDDSLVPIKTLKKVDELNLQSALPEDENVQNRALQDELLTIPGVMITDTPVRYYPLGEKAAHLVGYVQNVTAEDLEEHKGEGYLSDSVIGRSGMEGLFEKELKGQNGRIISIVTSQGEEKQVLAAIPRIDGQDITLTIDSSLQELVYDAFRDSKSCTVAMNPYTGEVLALVNTPSYDNNDFILGMSEETWTELNEDERKPMLNRFRQRFAPGSSFKPITGVIGLTAGVLTPDENFGEDAAGLSWQKDAGWGGYHVTTLHGYSPVNLKNAYIYSDNIYFAKAALKIGYDDFMAGLDRLGFNQKLPFEISVAESQYSNADRIETEIQLADSGYGQGQVLVNPIHLASLYTMFPNQGKVLKPYLIYKDTPVPEIWIEDACTQETAETVEDAMKAVISSEHGTGHAAMRSDITLAGKTGTAEIKASKEDTSGTELGWFAVYTADKDIQKPVLMVSMVEDVKNAGGSGLVVRKSRDVLGAYIPSGQ